MTDLRDHRSPDRVKMRPTDCDGFREAWAILERPWDRDVRPSLDEQLASHVTALQKES